MANRVDDRVAELEARLERNGRTDGAVGNEVHAATTVEDAERVSRTANVGKKAIEAEEAAGIAGKTAKAGQEVGKVGEFEEGAEIALGFGSVGRTLSGIEQVVKRVTNTATQAQTALNRTQATLQQNQTMPQSWTEILDVNKDGKVNLEDAKVALKGKGATQAAAAKSEAVTPAGMPAGYYDIISTSMPKALRVDENGQRYAQRYTKKQSTNDKPPGK